MVFLKHEKERKYKVILNHENNDFFKSRFCVCVKNCKGNPEEIEMLTLFLHFVFCFHI